jgi:hypothetical protein
MTKSQLKQLIRETINEATQPQKVVGKYIYFVDSKELYSMNPYKLVANRCDISVANNWTKATVMQGEDVRDMGIDSVTDISAWYIVNNATSDHAYTAYIGK